MPGKTADHECIAAVRAVSAPVPHEPLACDIPTELLSDLRCLLCSHPVLGFRPPAKHTTINGYQQIIQNITIQFQVLHLNF